MITTTIKNQNTDKRVPQRRNSMSSWWLKCTVQAVVAIAERSELAAETTLAVHVIYHYLERFW